MKKLTFIVFGIMLAMGIHAQQVDRDMVVVEGFTGFWWGFCPGAAFGADELIENGHNVAVIEYHTGDSLENVYSTARDNYYNISGYPTMMFDGVLDVSGGYSNQSMYPFYVPKVNQRNAVLSDFTIEIELEHTGFDYTTTIIMENVGGNTSSNLVLHLVVTESGLPIVWGMGEVVNSVCRLMVTF